jgi:hypothetical protein
MTNRSKGIASAMPAGPVPRSTFGDLFAQNPWGGEAPVRALPPQARPVRAAPAEVSPRGAALAGALLAAPVCCGSGPICVGAARVAPVGAKLIRAARANA